MEVIYKKQRIKLPIIKCIKIEHYKNILKLRKYLRRSLLLLEYFKKYVIILICIIIYTLIVTLLGINIGKYKNIWESIWENKQVLFTCLIIPYFAAIYVEIKNRKEKLLIENYFYTNFKTIVAKYAIYFKNNIKNYKMIITKREIQNELKSDEIIYEKNFDVLYKEMDDLLYDMIVSAKKGETEIDLSDIFKRLKFENRKMYKIYKNNNILHNKDIENFQYKCNIVFGNISWMWIRDDDIHKRIDKIIKSKTL